MSILLRLQIYTSCSDQCVIALKLESLVPITQLFLSVKYINKNCILNIVGLSSISCVLSFSLNGGKHDPTFITKTLYKHTIRESKLRGNFLYMFFFRYFVSHISLLNGLSPSHSIGASKILLSSPSFFPLWNIQIETALRIKYICDPLWTWFCVFSCHKTKSFIILNF